MAMNTGGDDRIFYGEDVLHMQAPGYGVYGTVVGSQGDHLILEPHTNRGDAKARRWLALRAEVLTKAEQRAQQERRARLAIRAALRKAAA